MPSVAILWPLIRILLDAVILQIVATVVPGLRIDNWGTAFTAAIVMAVVGWVASPLLAYLPQTGFWLFVLLELVLTTIILGMTSLFLDGMEFRGFGALVLAALLVTFLDFAPFVLGPHLVRLMSSE